MRVEETVDGETLRIKLKDRLSFSDHGVFRDVLNSVATTKPRACIFDLSELSSVDSAGLGMLMIAHDAAKKQGWSLSIQSPQANVMKLLEVACFDKILTIHR